MRSANRPETVCVKGAGCVVTWQEDPDGIRPGEGEGPGEGWSGAVAHHQTDTWYSYIDWDDFDLVSGDGTYGAFLGDPAIVGDSLATWIAANPTGSPQCRRADVRPDAPDRQRHVHRRRTASPTASSTTTATAPPTSAPARSRSPSRPQRGRPRMWRCASPRTAA